MSSESLLDDSSHIAQIEHYLAASYPRIQLLRKIPEYLLLQTSTWIVLLRVTIVLARGILQTARILLALTNSIVW